MSLSIIYKLSKWKNSCVGIAGKIYCITLKNPLPAIAVERKGRLITGDGHPVTVMVVMAVLPRVVAVVRALRFTLKLV